MDFDKEAREIFHKWETVGELKLRAGELTAQEVRTVLAVVKVIKAESTQALRRAFLAGQENMRERAARKCLELSWSNRSTPMLGPEMNCLSCSEEIRSIPLLEEPNKEVAG